MQRCVKVLLPATILMLFVFMPAEAAAQAELSPFIGYLFGSDIDPDGGGAALLLDRSFENSLTWGVRGGYFFGANGNVGVEGEFSQSPFANITVGGTELDNRATYVNLNLVVQSSGPGPRVYGTGGLGMTRWRLGAREGGATHTKLGVNFGGGVKVPMGTITSGMWGLRFDVRDQWLQLEADDSIRSNFKNALSLPTNSTSSIHNVITTFSVYFGF